MTPVIVRILKCILAFYSLKASNLKTATPSAHTHTRAQTHSPSMRPATEQPKSRSQPAPPGAAPGPKRRKRRPGGGRPKRRKNEGGAEQSEEAQVPPEAPPTSRRVPFRSVLEAEAMLAFGERQVVAAAAAREPSEAPPPPARPLTCQSAEVPRPPGAPHLGFLPQIDRWLHAALQDAGAYYQRQRYATAAARYSAALELCSKGAVLGRAFDADYEDISKVTSFIQSKLVTCYLRMKRPDLALTHSHRSIYLNPIHYRNHFRQAVVYRLLGRPREAARSAMTADFVYWLSGGSERSVSGVIKRYWQAMLEQAVAREDGFSVMYTPCQAAPTEEGIEKMMEAFRKKHPAFTQYLFTDPSGGHLLPQTTDWTGPPSQRYALTLGFRRQEDGNFLDKLLTRKYPIFTGSRAPFAPLTVEDLQGMTDSLESRILPVLDFLKCTKLAVGIRVRFKTAAWAGLLDPQEPSTAHATPFSPWFSSRRLEVFEICDKSPKSEPSRCSHPSPAVVSGGVVFGGGGVVFGGGGVVRTPPLHSQACFPPQVGVSAGSGLLERLQRAEYLGRLQRTTEQTLALHQALAELAIAPYLQDLSPADSQLLQSLMADSMDALEGGRTDKERVWSEMQKVGLLEELVYEQEESFLRDKAARGGQRKPKAARKPRGRKRIPPPALTPPGRDDRGGYRTSAP
ncbi:spermatogenesis-associated protein 16-like [Anguilla anguilla]|uniref:spermatogenesis-associated protein 16-like n=1 Tax=Anguilla anguilla TaxID=7936 RepID=UPI0015AF404D|nr:spermatogenesis-associated protein 16-like [Anguilla anguilla]